MLVPDFLDTMVERFADLGQNNPAAKVTSPPQVHKFKVKFQVRPPYSCKMLAYLALLSVCPPASMDQVRFLNTK